MNFVLRKMKNACYGIFFIALIVSPIFIPIFLINCLPNAKPVHIVIFWIQLIIVTGSPFILCIGISKGKWIILERLISFFLCSMLIAEQTVPMFKDIPALLAGHYSCIEGQATEIENPSRSFIQYVTVGEKRVAFTLDSIVCRRENRSKYYRIEYLPNSKFGISAIEIQKQ